jgi:hypothetical protein
MLTFPCSHDIGLRNARVGVLDSILWRKRSDVAQRNVNISLLPTCYMNFFKCTHDITVIPDRERERAIGRLFI